MWAFLEACACLCVCEKTSHRWRQAGSLAGRSYERRGNALMRDASVMFERVFVCSREIKAGEKKVVVNGVGRETW